MDRAGDRAVAVALREDQLLVIRRCHQGRRYAVLPGGGVESNETSRTAALREMQEETGLTGTLDRHLWTLADDARSAADYFQVTVPMSPMAVSGPEVERQSPDNSYEPVWIPISQLDIENLQPVPVRPLIRRLLHADRS